MNESDHSRDALDAVVRRLRTAHNSALAVVHDEQTEHVGYWDNSQRLVDTGALVYVQKQGFRIIYAGTKGCGEAGRKQAWMEVRRQDPSGVYADENSPLEDGEGR